MPLQTLEQSGAQGLDTDALAAKQQAELARLRAQEQFQRQGMEDLLTEGQQTAKKQEVKKMDWFFFLVFLVVCLAGDLVEIFTVGTLGWVFGLFVDLILLMAFGLSKSGKKQFKRMLAGIGIETIPFINILPLRTLFLIWAFVKSRRAHREELPA